MFILQYNFIPYQPGDEDIELDAGLMTSTQSLLVTQNKLFPPFPNPASEELTIGFSLVNTQSISLSLYDLEGKLVKTFITQKNYPANLHREVIRLNDLAAGNYILKLDGEDFQLSEQLIVVKGK